jgi:hypothetical protein
MLWSMSSVAEFCTHATLNLLPISNPIGKTQSLPKRCVCHDDKDAVANVLANQVIRKPGDQSRAALGSAPTAIA